MWSEWPWRGVGRVVSRRWRSVSDANGIVNARYIHLGWNERNCCFARSAARYYGWDEEPDDRVGFLLGIDAQWMYSGRIEEFEASDPLRGGWLGEDGGDGRCGIQLAQGSFMAVIWFVLGDEHHVWFGYVRQILDG